MTFAKPRGFAAVIVETTAVETIFGEEAAAFDAICEERIVADLVTGAEDRLPIAQQATESLGERRRVGDAEGRREVVVVGGDMLFGWLNGPVRSPDQR